MKRSEALLKIKEFNSYTDPDDDRSFEEQILDFVELNLRMLPPYEGDSNLYEYDCFNGGHYDQVELRWEAEDE